MISVIIPSRLLHRVDKAAQLRNNTANKKNYVNRKKSKDNSLQVNKYGLLGELAFHLLTGLKPTNEVDSLDLYDFTLPDGRTVDVKHTPHDSGTLVLGPKASRDPGKLADIYVLTKGREHIIDVVGYRGGKTLYNSLKYHPGIKQDKRFLTQEELIPIEYLISVGG